MNPEKEVLYCESYGGFSISPAALKELYKLDQQLYKNSAVGFVQIDLSNLR